jgi:DNA-binding NarL/FixJ family response regulator
LAIAGLYEDALRVAGEAESYAKAERLIFVLPHAKRMKVMANLGLRRFSRAGRLIYSLERDAQRAENDFLKVEAQLLRARLLLSQKLFDRAVNVMSASPERFPFEGERAEYLATLGLSLACAGERRKALAHAEKAESVARTIEAAVLVPCTRAIVSSLARCEDATELSVAAFQTALELKNVDSFVLAYRACPQLLSQVAGNSAASDEELRRVLESAKDQDLADQNGLSAAKAGRDVLSPREREVLTMLAQGLTNREIAGALYISEATAKVHVRHILGKLGVRTRTEAAVRAASTEGHQTS